MVLDLFSSWTGCLQVLFGVATDFWLPMLPALQFIAQHLQMHCEFGSIDRSHVSLRNKEFAGLGTSGCSTRLLGHVEDDRMSMQLRCGVAINGTGGIVFKSSGNKFAGSLRRVNLRWTLRTSGFVRSARSTQEGRADGASSGIPREIKGTWRYRYGVKTGVLPALGVRGCPKPTLPKSANCFEILVSAAGLEPATHALKGHCSTN